jgi:hypothetical protein
VLHDAFVDQRDDLDVDRARPALSGAEDSLERDELLLAVDGSMGPHDPNPVRHGELDRAGCAGVDGVRGERAFHATLSGLGLVPGGDVRPRQLTGEHLVEVDVGLDEGRKDDPALRVEPLGGREPPGLRPDRLDYSVAYRDRDGISGAIGSNALDGEIEHLVVFVQARLSSAAPRKLSQVMSGSSPRGPEGPQVSTRRVFPRRG